MSKSSKVIKQDIAWTREDLLTHKTTSAKVRFLWASGESRSEIAKILNIRYQHVRNVLVTELKKA